MNASRQGLGSTFRTAAGTLRGRGVEVFTVVAIVGGSLLVVADFLTLFRIESSGLVAETQAGGSHHAYAMAIIGAAIIGATLLTRASEQVPPAVGIVALGVLALVIALTLDRPDATRSDLLPGARIGDAEPAIGFWLELIGALIAVFAGTVLALLLRARGRS